MTNSNDRGYASVWRKDSGRLKASGIIKITPELLKYWATLAPDNYGNVQLDLVLFTNDRATNDRAPQLTGYVHPSQPRQPRQPSGQSLGSDIRQSNEDYDSLF